MERHLGGSYVGSIGGGAGHLARISFHGYPDLKYSMANETRRCISIRSIPLSSDHRSKFEGMLKIMGCKMEEIRPDIISSYLGPANCWNASI